MAKSGHTGIGQSVQLIGPNPIASKFFSYLRIRKSREETKKFFLLFSLERFFHEESGENLRRFSSIKKLL